MFYYKQMNEEGKLVSVSSSTNCISVNTEGLVSITKEEFDEISAQMYMKLADEERISEEKADAERERIENLEKENAALLFQVLTGEEYSDV